MSTGEIRFDDGAAYERYMGVWSQLAGQTFLDWIAPRHGMDWLDVGCGNGAFTQLILSRSAPASVQGIDPSAEQLAFARTQSSLARAQFTQADAMALPFPDQSFDAAVMPLVIFFLPDPAQGARELARVLRPGGIAAAYAWDLEGGGFPYESLWQEVESMGVQVPQPPRPDAARLDSLHELWTSAHFQNVETRTIEVQRTFQNFDDYWTTILGGPSVKTTIATMPAEDFAKLKDRMRALLPTESTGTITYSARANAVKGHRI